MTKAVGQQWIYSVDLIKLPKLTNTIEYLKVFDRADIVELTNSVVLDRMSLTTAVGKLPDNGNSVRPTEETSQLSFQSFVSNKLRPTQPN